MRTLRTISAYGRFFGKLTLVEVGLVILALAQPATGEMKNEMLNAGLRETAPAKAAKWVGAFSAAAATAVEASAASTVIKKANSLTNGEVLVFTVISGGAGLVALRPYYIVGRTASQFELAMTLGGAAVAFTTELKVASEFQILTEMSGGGYKRLATAFAVAAAGASEDSTAHELKIPAGKTIEYLGYWSLETAGSLMGVNVVTKEKFEAEGVYKVTATKSDMNLAEGTPAP